MATVKISPAMTSDLGWPQGAGTVVDGSATDTSVEVRSSMVGDNYKLTGHDFVYEDDVLVGGVVTEYVYLAGDLEYRKITDFEWDIAASGFTWPNRPESFILVGDDAVTGSRANDFLFSYAGDDTITGGKGRDVIAGGEGDDTLKGGGGRDLFEFNEGDGSDTIIDFNASRPGRDRIDIDGVDDISDVEISQKGHDVVIQYGEDDTIVLQNVDLHDLSPRHFLI